MPQDNSGSKKTLDEIHETYEYEEKPQRRWPAALAYLWAAFLVAVVIVFGGRWVYRTFHDGNSGNKSASKSQNGTTGVGTEKQAGKGSTIVPDTQTSSNKAAQSSATAPTPTEVPNTGDGAPNPDTLPNTGG